MSDELQLRLDAIAAEGSEYKARIEGHKAAAATYREYGMDVHADMIDKTIASIEETLRLLRDEWHRLKKLQSQMPY